MAAAGLDTVYPLLAFFAVALGGAFVWRTGSNRAWKDAAEGWRAEAELRHQELERAREMEVQLRQTIASLNETIAKLEALPRVEGLVKMMAETSERQERHAKDIMELAVTSLSKQIDECERRAEERHVALIEMHRGLPGAS